MKKSDAETGAFTKMLKRKEAELACVLRNRDGLAIEKSADQLDEIQYATERDVAMLNINRESILLREVKSALRRFSDGSFGTCVQCEEAISPKRLAAVPWAPRCIQCQEAADRDGKQGMESSDGAFTNAA
jgi:DnaK suppressor protein